MNVALDLIEREFIKRVRKKGTSEIAHQEYLLWRKHYLDAVISADKEEKKYLESPYPPASGSLTAEAAKPLRFVPADTTEDNTVEVNKGRVGSPSQDQPQAEEEIPVGPIDQRVTPAQQRALVLIRKVLESHKAESTFSAKFPNDFDVAGMEVYLQLMRSPWKVVPGSITKSMDDPLKSNGKGEAIRNSQAWQVTFTR